MAKSDIAARNLLIGGEAGQGLVTIGLALAKCLVRGGYSITVTQSYQSRIRGGHNSFALRVGTNAVEAPREELDLLVALHAETVELHGGNLAPQGLIIADESFAEAEEGRLAVPLNRLAAKRYVNTVALGVVAAVLGLEKEQVGQALADIIQTKHAETLEENRQAIDKAYAWVDGQTVRFEPLPPVERPEKQRLMLCGNEAIALGALAAGLRFYSFYPMTPATSIGMTLIGHAEPFGLIVEQAEDEIAAINMAVGASFAGAAAMVGTSGGGFALMTEGVSLTAMIETPLVIAVSQRPGPATGLPTRTEQADLELVLYAGHGEFPRAVLAPGTVEQCYGLTRESFRLAEESQGPVFILTDQFLADSYRAVDRADLPAPMPASPVEPAVDSARPYRRYALTPSGVSPRLLPGRTEHLVVADSDEHTEDGHLTEDLAVRERMVRKRLAKLEVLRANVIAPELSGDEEPDLLLVCWGSTRGAVLEAARLLQTDARRVASLHFSQVWPLVPEQFVDVLRAAAEVVMVEGNATGQFARLIRAETGFQITRKVLRYDGLPITPDYIVRALDSKE